MEPPSYEESNDCHKTHDYAKDDSKLPHVLNIADEVGISRSQHVAALVTKLEIRIRDRARAGISKTLLLILPSDHESLSSSGTLVGVAEDHTAIQLQGRFDGLQFWAQREALEELQSQLLAAISGDMPIKKSEVPFAPVPALPERTSRVSFFGRRSNKMPEPQTAPPVLKPAVIVDVKLEDAHFRSENDYGLYQTKAGRCVLVMAEIL